MDRSIAMAFLVRGACLFGSWTLFCYVLIFTESSFDVLRSWSIVPLLVGLVLGSLCVGGTESIDAGIVKRAGRPIPAGRGEIFSLLAIILLCIVLRIVDAPWWLVWTVLLCAIALGFWWVSHTDIEPGEMRVPLLNSQRFAVICLVICGAILVAITHRADRDDAQYLNFVVTALDFPSEPLFSRSGMWQDRNTPLETPIYRLHTYELLVAVLSDVFGMGHRIFYYLIMAPIFGGVAVLVHWALARHLVPRHALAVLMVWLVLIIALGASHREFGNFAFVRLYQAKAVLVAVGVPLCLLLGLRFAEQPTWRRALALGLAMIASLGMSSSALIVVPIAVAAAISGGVLRMRVSGAHNRTARHGFAVIVAAIVVALAAVVYSTVLVDHETVVPVTEEGIALVLGEGPLGALVLALFPFAPLFVNDPRRRALYLMATAAHVMVVLNPWTAPLLAATLDSVFLWRVFWSTPLVLSASIVLGALAVLLRDRVPGIARHAVLPTLLVALSLLSPQSTLSPGNLVELDLPRFKVESDAHAVAEEIVRIAPRRSTVYASIPIASLVSTIRRHPYPLMVRLEYSGFERIREHFGDMEMIRRRRVIFFLEGIDTHPSTPEFFAAQLESDRPAIVAYDGGVSTASQVGALLGNAGYIGEKRGPYMLWVRQ